MVTEGDARDMQDGRDAYDGRRDALDPTCDPSRDDGVDAEAGCKGLGLRRGLGMGSTVRKR